MLFLIKEEECR